MLLARLTKWLNPALFVVLALLTSEEVQAASLCQKGKFSDELSVQMLLLAVA